MRTLFSAILALSLSLGLLPAARAVPPAPGCDPEPGPLAAIQAAVELALDGESEDGIDWRVESICRRGDWAYAFVKGYLGGAPVPAPSHVALARWTEDGWQAALPERPFRYNAWLAEAPGQLLPAGARIILNQPTADNLQALSTFTNFWMPFPAGQSAYVIKHWYPAVDFSAGAAGGGPPLIRNAKAGTVVFAKDSSARECGDPPVDWECWRWSNAVVIQTGVNEYAWYLHMTQNSVPDVVREGAHVPAGTDLGWEGATGWASAPHLHFMVSTTFECCDGEGDGRFPKWPANTVYRMDFYEYAWSKLPYIALSQNGDPAVAPPVKTPEPSAPAPVPTRAVPLPTPVPTQPPADANALCPSPYLVRPGDWLLRIAQSCGTTVQNIALANPGLNPNLIYAGQRLNMPSVGGGPAPTQAAPVPTQPPPEATAPPPVQANRACLDPHTVAANENLFRLALNCGLTTERLAAANGIPYPYVIYVGQMIRYP